MAIPAVGPPRRGRVIIPERATVTVLHGDVSGDRRQISSTTAHAKMAHLTGEANQTWRLGVCLFTTKVPLSAPSRMVSTPCWKGEQQGELDGVRRGTSEAE